MRDPKRPDHPQNPSDHPRQDPPDPPGGGGGDDGKNGKLLKSHRHLAVNAEEIREALNKRPDLGGMLFVNPALVLEDLGYTLSPEVRSHILRNLSLPQATRDAMAALEKEILEALGEGASELNLVSPRHTAQILFKCLGLQPLDTTGAQPPYKPETPSPRLGALDVAATQVKRKLRPRQRRPGGPQGLTVSYQKYVPQVSFLDPEGPLPELPPAETAPEELPTDQLIFYRDAHALVPKLLRYQILYHSQLAFRSSATYREIRDGQRPSVWRSWIKSVTFPQGRGG